MNLSRMPVHTGQFTPAARLIGSYLTADALVFVRLQLAVMDIAKWIPSLGS
jgi:hypothetical protein